MARNDDVAVLYVGNESPRITRSLTDYFGATTIPPGTTYKLFVRQRDSATIVLQEPMIYDEDTESVYYEPESNDFLLQGYYRAWVQLNVGSSSITQDVDEFDLLVLDHSPGKGITTGAIAQQSSWKVPVAWSALANRSGYGDPALQSIVDLIKLRWLSSAGITVTAAQERTLDPRVINFLAHMTSLEILQVAVEYWTGEYQSQSTASGAAEVHSFPDRIAAALKLIDLLNARTSELQLEAEQVLGKNLSASTGGISMFGGGESITPGIGDDSGVVDFGYGFVGGYHGDWWE